MDLIILVLVFSIDFGSITLTMNRKLAISAPIEKEFANETIILFVSEK